MPAAKPKAKKSARRGGRVDRRPGRLGNAVVVFLAVVLTLTPGCRWSPPSSRWPPTRRRRGS